MSAQLHVVFDGNCGFCTRAVGWVRVLDRHGRIELHASQCPGVLERFGLTPEQADSSVWAVRDETTSGAHAVAVVLDTALGRRLVERVYRLPLVGRTLEAAYRWVAEHRHMFPGVTPWCEAHPGQCGSAGQA
ncbi:DUF393 domain-containing protein [Glutamicibacter protophormiae]|uniref:C2H2-type domain-containing protein n=1 Tax=Kocuria varians TaxID=1272 RepID=A0A7D7KXC0_KOCVA|nr:MULTISPECIES: DUF393 domain-containing protein [Kocuria]MDN5631299.1 DUF393 domain-containing protein [Kocuria sp.]QMS55565.1 hypothetical protein CIB50_0000251 [Kocuria varians]WNB88924.1 DUF393 domain-containing protein [Glutamicibacter protophormiae]